jgi:hypothetical protein
LILLWVITGAALVVALVALSQARRTARRLDQLSKMYWELKYQHGELRVQLQRATGELPDTPRPPAPRPHEGGGEPSFIPLTSLKR